jgi:hypothetical protein
MVPWQKQNHTRQTLANLLNIAGEFQKTKSNKENDRQPLGAYCDNRPEVFWEGPKNEIF